jgi:membrane associated rhomboid family serine protease
MGIYDREYYRSASSGFLARGQACKWLIIINVAVFVAQLVTEPSRAPVWMDEPPQQTLSVTDALKLDTDLVLHGQVWRLLTYAFAHSTFSWMHIVFNMLFLYWFGADMEDLYGTREFLAFYLTAAVAGGIAFVVFSLAGVPGHQAVGASGAVMAVLMLCAIHYPNRTILLFFILPVPIWAFLVLELAPDAWAFLSGLKHHQMAGNTAVTIHLAGAGFGYLYYKRHWRLIRFWDGLLSWKRQLTRPRLRVYQGEPVHAPAPASPPPAQFDEHMEAKLDAVLAKVARSGRDSLTDQERDILLRASELYKRRRT